MTEPTGTIVRHDVRHRSLAAALLCLTAAAVFVAVPLAGHTAFYVVVGLMWLACFLPAIRDWTHGRLDYFEVIHPLGLIYFLNMGLGAVWIVREPQLAYYPGVVSHVPLAALYSLVGYVCLLIGYYAFWRRSPAGRTTEEVPEGTQLLVIPGIIGLVGYFAWNNAVRATFFNNAVLSGVASLLGQLFPLFFFSWAVAWMLLLSGRMTVRQKGALILLLVPCAVALGRASLSDKSLIMTIVLIPLIAFWYARRRLPWVGLVVLALILIFVVFPVYNTYRNFDARLAVDKRLELTRETMARWNSAEYLDHSVTSFKRRIALIDSFAVVLRDVGYRVPYLRGRVFYLTPMVVLIPRILWPDKPELKLGREFGHVFHIVHPLDNRTSIAPTIPGELYWNFALPGVIVGMTLIGASLRWLYEAYGRCNGLDPIRRGVYIVTLMQVLLTEGNIVSAGGGIAKVLVILMAYRWVGRRAGFLRVIGAEASLPPRARAERAAPARS